MTMLRVIVDESDSPALRDEAFENTLKMMGVEV